ncbi:MAG: DUF5694 domain-containing protein [Ferruginibacter sp.]
MKLIILLFIFSSTSMLTLAQKKEEIRKASSFFPKERAKILFVGTFHFDYPGLDFHKTDDTKKIDVLKEPKKSEVTELVNYIKRFKPTKIAIEAVPEWKANEKLIEYKKGRLKDQRDERFQLGMRIASEMKLDTIYSIDAPSLDEDLMKIDSTFIKTLFKDFDFESSDNFEKYYKKWLNYEDELPSKTNLLNYFKHFNSKESHQIGYGAYLIGDFKLDNHRGADILSIWWYNRNLRIFRKLQEITENKEDRILIIFGNGHGSILRQLFESSPEYEFVEFDNLK